MAVATDALTVKLPDNSIQLRGLRLGVDARCVPLIS